MQDLECGSVKYRFIPFFGAMRKFTRFYTAQGRIKGDILMPKNNFLQKASKLNPPSLLQTLQNQLLPLLMDTNPLLDPEIGATP